MGFFKKSATEAEETERVGREAKELEKVILNLSHVDQAKVLITLTRHAPRFAETRLFTDFANRMGAANSLDDPEYKRWLASVTGEEQPS